MDELGVFHVNLLIHILTKGEVGVVKLSSKIFLLTVPRRTSFVEYLCYLCLVFSCVCVCSLLPCGHLLGKG